MLHRVLVLPEKRNMEVPSGTNLLEALRQAGLFLNAPCGGSGRCGKCKVTVDGVEMLACRVSVDRNMTVRLPQIQPGNILAEGIRRDLSPDSGLCLAVDIGTTTVAAYLAENGSLLAAETAQNPQAAYGADVVSRLQLAAQGNAPALTAAIRSCLESLTNTLLTKTGKKTLHRVCLVGNPAMQQLFMGLPTENLTKLPFHPLLSAAKAGDAGNYLPVWSGAELLTVPDIAAFLGADTVACIVATNMDREDALTLLVDIGTNGEMVLGNRSGLVACATAAGPALEGAGIRFGMQAAPGAIDRVSRDFSCHVIGEGCATGICGSGLLDAVAVSLEQGLLNERGRIQEEDRRLPLTEDIYLTQEDIRQLQQAKGAIAAGIRLMAAHLGVSLADIEKVYLAGAFGTFLDPHSACRVGLIPAELEEKIRPVGNAAGSGALQIACNGGDFARTQTIASSVKHLDLAALPEWAKCFAHSMRLDSEADYWCRRALGLGFSRAVPMDPVKLAARADVRAMCAADKCRAYGKNWTCPPHCGTLEVCEERMRQYAAGILLQTVGETRKTVDTKAYRQTEQRHLRQFYAIADAIKERNPEALCLGSGGCRVCDRCAWPEPCRFPEKACASMEAYGLFVTQVCRDNGLAYHYGEKTVTYTACILF